MNSSSAAVLFLFFIFSANPFSLSATAAKEPVLDTDGEELRLGTPYYIQSAIQGAGGLELVSLFSTGIPCPKIVAQSQSTNGLAVFFNPVDSTDTTVHLSTDVNIRFPSFDPYCRSSNTWRVAPYSTLPGHWWIANGGEIDNPGPQTLLTRFKIERVEVGYKLTFCPTVCESCVTLCNDIGKYNYQNQVLLGLTKGDAWPFVFVKAFKAIEQVVEKHSE
ncbi:ARABIDOPSIS THALIANA KUNITZ TRYPSIN INHIBITOR 5 [Hibiscus trionum]|uniref:ARABIDOPSIS THALIANA KUNITZ TRYPSIN INHIBITOR 5 n=1 Tax=Hibiscus trionum TaxID=183268 RepID=A0A9W7MRH5_HIBTR|nr:ARABIDOPSIS THALIANA KUNITZ TRYPSIN INHIBITOR 5 [Hibiscus trionum]GMJ06628.1 ARABIDOPSIS THALIANA KUNITZ TRYPSIN INHIBITOR 5 [Hibiscus trionum]